MMDSIVSDDVPCLFHLEQMLDYNVLGGKCNRGLSVIDSYKILKGVDVLSKEEMFLACTLGWCIEWVILPATVVFRHIC